jgi:hypothetical protein
MPARAGLKIKDVMQITSRTNRRGVRGYALTITLIFAAVMLLIFAGMMNWVSSNAKVTLRNNQYNMSQAAAEAATETVLAQMDRDFLGQSLTTSTYYASLPINQNSWPVQYVFSDSNGANAGNISVNLGPPATNSVQLNSQFKGLYGLVQDCTLVATATPVSQPQSVPAKITETLQFATIPLFQFAIFYNVNLEICPGQNMVITGPVFCNQSIWEGSEFTTFSNTVSAVGTNDTLATDAFDNNNYSPYNGTTAVNFLLAGQPTKNCNSIVMPIGTNNNPAAIRAILDLPPPAYQMGTDPAYSTNGQVYLANAADLVITNFFYGTNFGNQTLTGTNFIIYYQNKNQIFFRLEPVTNDFYTLKVPAPTGSTTNYVSLNKSDGLRCYTNVLYAGYSFATNVIFYDWREGGNNGGGPAKKVQALQIDISLFNKWLTNGAVNGGSNYNYLNQNGGTSKGHPIDSIYVYNNVPLSSTTLPAVSVINGKQLPSSYGFTIATPFPLYVKGNYNSQNASGSALGSSDTTHTYPAALMADAITILSTSWNDATVSRNPPPGDTTVNAAMLEGIVQTDPSISGDYSGGVENFMRLLEDWQGSSKTLTYNGSIVVMFYSSYATNHWNFGNYYTAPTRNWAFDTNFKNPSKLPPLTPQSKTIIRGNWLAQ